MANSSDKRVAIYLHGGWRCASTYVWSRFRESPFTVCFYEPFGERLARCTRKRIGRDTASGWRSRHPQLVHPYREEYLPLLRFGRQGVRGYREEFALERYFPKDETVAPEARYLSRLARHADSRARHPVFGFSRSLGRAALLRRELGGYHIVLRRNPLQQWLSCRSYREHVPRRYFELCHFLILALAPADSPAGRFAETLGLPRMPRGLEHQLRRLHAAMHPWSDALSYRAFTAVSLLSHAAAEPAADLVLDVDRLGRSESYRGTVSARILGDVRLAVNFDDCRVPTHDAERVPIDFRAIESEVARTLLALGADLDPIAAAPQQATRVVA